MFNILKNKKSQIRDLYEKLLNRKADFSGLSSYLNSDLSIDDIKSDIIKSNEYFEISKNNYKKNFPLIFVSKKKNINNWQQGLQKFFTIDSEENFNNNKKILGNNWTYYDDNKISYYFNSHGYRMKEFEKINWKNYIATFGCSYTVGHGLALEDTFSYKISNYLNCDLVNAAICGGSNDLIVSNLFRILKLENKPKFVIINWTSPLRKSYWINGEKILYLPMYEEGGDWDNSYNNYLQNEENMLYCFLEQRMIVQNLCKISNVFLWELTNFSFFKNFVNDLDYIHFEPNNTNNFNIDFINKTFARDIRWHNNSNFDAHPGIDLQEQIFNKWKQIKTNI